MGSKPASAELAYVGAGVKTALKILVVGHFAVGKTTFIATMSEIPPLRTEERMTRAASHLDDLTGVQDKSTTTVAMDFGRLTLSERIVLYMFGTPGQHRFVNLWQDMVRGALGALILVDPRRLDQSFPVIDLVERYGLPYTVAVNHFGDGEVYSDAELREALDLLPDTPLVTCDARDERSSAETLKTLVRHLQTLAS